MSHPLYMDAEIRPNRSLSQRGFVVLISVITGINAATAILFLMIGGVFVPFFLGIDVVAILVAFLASYRGARQVERVQVSAREVRVTYETPTSSRLVWESPTAFTRVLREVEEARVVALRLRLSGREVRVAEALSPRERTEFAAALERAIDEARRARG